MGQARSVKDTSVVGRRGDVGDSEAPQAALVYEARERRGNHTLQ